MFQPAELNQAFQIIHSELHQRHGKDSDKTRLVVLLNPHD